GDLPAHDSRPRGRARGDPARAGLIPTAFLRGSRTLLPPPRAGEGWGGGEALRRAGWGHRPEPRGRPDFRPSLRAAHTLPPPPLAGEGGGGGVPQSHARPLASPGPTL